jgi:hypothetical protein
MSRNKCGPCLCSTQSALRFPLFSDLQGDKSTESLIWESKRKEVQAEDASKPNRGSRKSRGNTRNETRHVERATWKKAGSQGPIRLA